uniref:Uncharacterized protein n=1 Tax=Timema poppense TaxID=170557 RepID=A0A7R9DUJ6_TIMPO|nr:unnamed protein product [Timema poppensis]
MATWKTKLDLRTLVMCANTLPMILLDFVLIMNGTTEPFDGKEENKFETSGDIVTYQLRSVISSQLCYLPTINLTKVEEVNREDHLARKGH